MADVMEGRITVRVQARGGKFLGDDIGGARQLSTGNVGTGTVTFIGNPPPPPSR